MLLALLHFEVIVLDNNSPVNIFFYSQPSVRSHASFINPYTVSTPCNDSHICLSKPQQFSFSHRIASPYPSKPLPVIVAAAASLIY